MDLADWLKTWLARHPLKAPSDADRARFTAQVMARVRAETRTGRAPVAWTERLLGLWPRLAVSLAAAAALLVGLSVLHSTESGPRLADRIIQDSELLTEVDEPVNGWLASDDTESLADELERTDAMVLAEAPQDDDSWVADTLQLLDRLNEELPDDAAGESNEDEWLKELQTLDESELAARS